MRLIEMFRSKDSKDLAQICKILGCERGEVVLAVEDVSSFVGRLIKKFGAMYGELEEENKRLKERIAGMEAK